MGNKGIQNKRELISKANKTMFVSVILASVVVSASIIGIKVLWDQRSFQSEVIDAKTKARNQLRDNIVAVEELTTEFEKLEEREVNSKIILDALPSKYDYPALATSVEKIAQLSGVQLESFAGEDDTENAIESAVQPEPVEIEFSVTVLGDYNSIRDFVVNTQKSIRPFDTRSLTIEGEGDNLQATVSFVTYYQPKKSLEIEKKSITSGGVSSSVPSTIDDGTGSGTGSPEDITGAEQ